MTDSAKNSVIKYLTDLGNSISLIDTGLLGESMVGCYLIEAQDELAIIETGNYLTVDRIIHILEQKKLACEQVKYVIATHIHLDHVGGASSLLKKLPNAKLLIHPSGLKHMLNPEHLISAATKVYGEQRFNAMYSDITPIEESRVVAVEDQAVFKIGSRALHFYHTPGHAYHHFCVWDPLDESWFTGDTFGVCYNSLKCSPRPLLIPTTTPTQFDPEALIQSVNLMLSKKPRRMLLTHFGELEVTEDMGTWLIDQIKDYVSLTKEHGPELKDYHDLKSILLQYTSELAKKHKLDIKLNELQQIIAMDLELNSQGLFYWYQKHHA